MNDAFVNNKEYSSKFFKSTKVRKGNFSVYFFFPQHSSPECSGIILVYSYLKVERTRCLLLVLDCFFSDTWFSHYFSVYTEDEGVLLQCLKNSVQPLLFVWKLVEYRSTIQTSLIWFGLDQMSTNWNLMLLRQMTM